MSSEGAIYADEFSWDACMARMVFHRSFCLVCAWTFTGGPHARHAHGTGAVGWWRRTKVLSQLRTRLAYGREGEQTDPGTQTTPKLSAVRFFNARYSACDEADYGETILKSGSTIEFAVYGRITFSGRDFISICSETLQSTVSCAPSNKLHQCMASDHGSTTGVSLPVWIF